MAVPLHSTLIGCCADYLVMSYVLTAYNLLVPGALRQIAQTSHVSSVQLCAVAIT